MHRDYSYRVGARVFVQYIGGETYQRVPEAAVRAITAASAGTVVEAVEPTSERVTADD